MGGSGPSSKNKCLIAIGARPAKQQAPRRIIPPASASAADVAWLRRSTRRASSSCMHVTPSYLSRINPIGINAQETPRASENAAIRCAAPTIMIADSSRNGNERCKYSRSRRVKSAPSEPSQSAAATSKSAVAAGIDNGKHRERRRSAIAPIKYRAHDYQSAEP